ncbi:MAG TPA: outer membrane beta-barrel protein [Kofleriaceae bacterium]|jgi:hypothetical protein
MRLRTLAFSLAPLLTASLAHAQAPGEVAVQPVVVAPVVVAPVVAQPVVVAPVVVAPAAGAAPIAAPGTAPVDAGCAQAAGRESVMANRWSIGLSVGSMSLAPEGAPDDQTAFALGELALRFRATPHLELELSAGGGRERTADDQDGDLQVNTAAIAARYRFRPEAAWNWFVLAGIGGASVTHHDATQQERSDATQPFGMLGIGVERRFHHLALQAELRGVGLGKARQDAAPGAAVEPPMTEAATVMTPTTTSANTARSGGAFSIGLSYYF